MGPCIYCGFPEDSCICAGCSQRPPEPESPMPDVPHEAHIQLCSAYAEALADANKRVEQTDARIRELEAQLCESRNMEAEYKRRADALGAELHLWSQYELAKEEYAKYPIKAQKAWLDEIEPKLFEMQNARAEDPGIQSHVIPKLFDNEHGEVKAVGKDEEDGK